jgi:AcrR family transcriptional regulator
MLHATSPDDISIRSVAQAVNRTTPQIYEHFDNREHLLHEAAKTALTDMAARVSQTIAQPAKGRSARTAKVAEEPAYRARLRARAHAYVDFAVSSPVAYRVLFMSPSTSEVPSSSLLAVAGMDAVISDLTEAQVDGRLAWPDVEYVALTMWVVLHGVASLRVAHPTTAWPPDLLDRLLDELTLGLIPRSMVANSTPNGD